MNEVNNSVAAFEALRAAIAWMDSSGELDENGCDISESGNDLINKLMPDDVTGVITLFTGLQNKLHTQKIRMHIKKNSASVFSILSRAIGWMEACKGLNGKGSVIVDFGKSVVSGIEEVTVLEVAAIAENNS